MVILSAGMRSLEIVRRNGTSCSRTVQRLSFSRSSMVLMACSLQRKSQQSPLRVVGYRLKCSAKLTPSTKSTAMMAFDTGKALFVHRLNAIAAKGRRVQTIPLAASPLGR